MPIENRATILPEERGGDVRIYRPGDSVLVRGKRAVFVKAWGAGAVVRYDDRPNDPRVVPLERLEPAQTADTRGRASGDAA